MRVMTGPIEVAAVGKRTGPTEQCNVIGHAQLTANRDTKI